MDHIFHDPYMNKIAETKCRYYDLQKVKLKLEVFGTHSKGFDYQNKPNEAYAQYKKTKYVHVLG